MTPLKDVASFSQLLEYLKNWRSSFDSLEEQYDFGGMAQLLGACLDNMRQFALESELEDLCEYLTAEQWKFLNSLSMEHGRQS